MGQLPWHMKAGDIVFAHCTPGGVCLPYALLMGPATDKHNTLAKWWESCAGLKPLCRLPRRSTSDNLLTKTVVTGWGKKNTWKVIECNTKKVTHGWGLEVQVKQIDTMDCPSLRNHAILAVWCIAFFFEVAWTQKSAAYCELIHISTYLTNDST